MRNRVVKVLLSLVVGAVGMAIGLYFGRFVGAVGVLFASSRQTSALVADTARWIFLGLIGGLGLAFTAVSRQRVRFVLVSLVGFALGGALASYLVFSSAGRNTLQASLAVPVGGALAGLLLGLSARLGIRSVLMLVASALAMLIAGAYIDPRGSVIPPSDWLSLLAPGALVGAVLAALVPEPGDAPPPR